MKLVSNVLSFAATLCDHIGVVNNVSDLDVNVDISEEMDYWQVTIVKESENRFVVRHLGSNTFIVNISSEGKFRKHNLSEIDDVERLFITEFLSLFV